MTLSCVTELIETIFLLGDFPFRFGRSAQFCSELAEGVRFELTRELAPSAGFQDRCLKPLGHPSDRKIQ